ncbi:MAG: hypothetical protein HRU19_27980 [Pseudobacteriovorax sp.]|nr:hypothetical protein [Pseudobacteriovorax sp.]
MYKSLIILICLGFIGACKADNTDNPDPSKFVGSQQPVTPGEEDVVADVPGADEVTPFEPVAPGEVTEDGVVLNVVPVADLPQKIRECAEQNVAGEVIEGLFSCNTQTLVDCATDLNEPQKKATLDYANVNLPGYSLWGCSSDLENNLAIHFFRVDGVSLKVFNLSVKRSTTDESTVPPP